MNEVVVITGGTSGIGKETAIAFLKQNKTVVVLARNLEPENLVNGIHYIKCDVSKVSEIENAFLQIKQQFGKINVLVNNAGFGVSGAVELIENGVIENIYNTNVLGIVMCSKHAIPLMGKGGKIVNIASAMAFFPIQFRTLYASSKSAVVSFSYGLRAELMESGISVCAVCPGDVKTNFSKNRIKSFETNEKYGNKIKSSTQHIDQKEHKRMSVEKVVTAILKVTKSKNNKPMVIVGLKYKVLYVVSKIMPTRLVLFFTKKFFSK